MAHSTSDLQYCPACAEPLSRKPTSVFRFCGNCRVELYEGSDLSNLPTTVPQESFAILKAGNAIDIVNAARKSGKRKSLLEIRKPLQLLPQSTRFVRKLQLIQGPSGQLNINIRKFKPITGTDLWYPSDNMLDKEIQPDDFNWTSHLWDLLIQSNLAVWKEFNGLQWRDHGQCAPVPEQCQIVLHWNASTGPDYLSDAFSKPTTLRQILTEYFPYNPHDQNARDKKAGPPIVPILFEYRIVADQEAQLEHARNHQLARRREQNVESHSSSILLDENTTSLDGSEKASNCGYEEELTEIDGEEWQKWHPINHDSNQESLPADRSLNRNLKRMHSAVGSSSTVSESTQLVQQTVPVCSNHVVKRTRSGKLFSIG